LTRCNLEFGLAQTGAKKTQTLETAKAQVVSFVSITSNFSEDWWPQFDGLYREIQTGLGKIPEPLEKPKEFVPAPVVENVPRDKGDSKKKVAEKPGPMVSKKDADGSGMTYAIFGLIALLGLGGGGFMVMKGSKSRKPSAALASVTVDSPVIAPPPAAAPRKKRAAGKGKSAAAPAEKPRRPLTPEEKEQVRRRRAAKAKAQEQAKKKPEGK